MVPPQVRAPRGADWAAQAAIWLFRKIGTTLWRALEVAGHRRAARELEQLANRWAPFDPERARVMREASRSEAQIAQALMGSRP